MRRLVIWLAMIVALLSFTVTNAHAQGGQSEEEKAREAEFREIIQAAFADYSTKDYDSAIKKFMQARVIIDDPDLLYNLALCYHKKGDCLEAKKHYEGFIKRKEKAGDSTSEQYMKAQKALKEKELVECKTTGTLQLTCTPQDKGVVSVDGGSPVSCSDLAALKFSDLSPGDHSVIVSAPGHESTADNVKIEPNKVTVKSYNLKLTEGSKIVVTPPTKEKEEGGVNWLGWSLTGGGVLLIGAAVAIDIINLSTQEELEGLPLGDSRRDEPESTYTTNQALILTFGSLGIVALGVGITFLIMEIGKPDPEPKSDTQDPNAFNDDAPSVRWHVLPSVGAEQVGGVLQLSF